MSGTRARRLAAGLGLSLLVLVLIEGASSGLWFGWEAWTRFERPIQERHHTRYDSELGWVNEPGMSDPDLYAPGRGITTNSQGFRNTRDFPVEVPAGRLRVICAGDSFTLGYGVDDSDSWPAQLAALDPRLETVNMGQGGYGVDQAWMWYRRDGLELDHQLLLFAFIGDDFERMRKATFRGYGKPLLKVVDGRIAVGNVPVPRSSFRFPLLTQNLPLLEELRIVELGRRVLRKLRGGEPAARRLDLDERQARELSLAIFRDLERATSARGARLALVLLPNLDSRRPGQLQGIPAYARAALEQAAAEGLAVLDLTPEFAALDPQPRQELFIPAGELPLPGAKGHYNARGNRFVAEALHARLLADGLLPPP
jgi:hypothetical protein